MSGPPCLPGELATLVDARNQRLAHALRVFAADPRVTGVFLGGSLGAASGDAFSDIDLRVVVKSSHHEAFVKRRLEIPSSWPGFVFNEWMPGTQHCVSDFDPFGKVDIFYYDEAHLEASPWYGLPIQILYDPNGVVGALLKRSHHLDFAVSSEDVSHSISKGLAALHEAIRRAKRGELIYSQTLLDELRQHIMQADDWLCGRTPTTAVYAKFDERGTEEVLAALKASYAPLEGRAILQAAAGLDRTYRQQVSDLHERFDLSRPLSSDMRAFELAEAARDLPQVRR